MKNSKTNQPESYNCPATKSRLFSGENDELVYLKVYKGDWGDWDEKPIIAHTEPCIHKKTKLPAENPISHK